MKFKRFDSIGVFTINTKLPILASKVFTDTKMLPPVIIPGSSHFCHALLIPAKSSKSKK